MGQGDERPAWSTGQPGLHKDASSSKKHKQTNKQTNKQTKANPNSVYRHYSTEVQKHSSYLHREMGSKGQRDLPTGTLLGSKWEDQATQATRTGLQAIKTEFLHGEALNFSSANTKLFYNKNLKQNKTTKT
jgi:hypothetical protein